MIKAILFDFDGVLTTDATGSLSICKYICKKTGLDIEIFEKEYYKYNDDLLYGKINHEDIWEKLCKGLNSKIDINILYESFINTPIDMQMIAFIDELKQQNYKIAMVTDNKKDCIDDIVKYYDWNKMFDSITVSAEIGSGKDCNEIFVKAIGELNVNTDECVFIDNQEKNLIVPKGMGMNSIYFDHEKRNYKKLIQEFKTLSINIT
ncbi:putative hydrolase of the HAD superfamily [Clostridium beijerinckii]|uniref:HAD family hydrolase n=1 Tax=Clostridium beijerinckii TaxID=1520 RepID=UPI00156ED8C3|nr:HAD-IA family hydrolase [Clostridium beijerinckii]NRT36406.1 putative hydrolase of the HAD superfamily [Clostridium beijerinckii]NRT44165.1 putative hydrolase of the HAD superfamily [Clostridium beijerinckii]NRZ21841.1 putative hydrolase of the HAD superfamily [Clostridium beijerinckii]